MLKTIKLKGCSPFTDAEFVDLQKVNYVYGPNGSGKSTVANFLQSSDSTRFQYSSADWTGTEQEPILVYDRKFREDNLKKDMYGIFTLGGESVEIRNEIERLSRERDELLKKKVSAENNKQQGETELREKEKEALENSWANIYKANETAFAKAFKLSKKTKAEFFNMLISHYESYPDNFNYDRDDLIRRTETLFKNESAQLDYFSVRFDSILNVFRQIEKDPVWAKVVVGSADLKVANLMKDLGNSSWVRAGMTYLRPGDGICPFCQQNTLTQEFIRELNLYFDGEYKKDLDRIQVLLNRYEETSSRLLDIINGIILNKEESVRVGKLNTDFLDSKIELLKGAVQNNIKIIRDKLKEPERKVELKDISSCCSDISSILESANEIIRAHNHLIENAEVEKNQLSEDVWNMCIKDNLSFLESYASEKSKCEKAIKGLMERIKGCSNRIAEIDTTIHEKEQCITSVKPTLNRINAQLKSFGFTSFSLEDAGNNFYCIRRENGDAAADTLSEGEATFLTFLYFMQKVEGACKPDNISRKRIIVLDDPICSLDSNVLYIVSTLVRDLALKVLEGGRDVVQLIVMTHNVYFHKQALPLEYGQDRKKGVKFFIIMKQNGESAIRAYDNNQILTSYELLWQEYKNSESTSSIAVRNVMRRIIEVYFKCIGKIDYEDISNHFDDPDDRKKVWMLVAWCNDGSHLINDDLYVDSYSEDVERYKSIFRDIFNVSGHIAHYNMMMGIENG